MLNRVRQPFNVNALAQAAALAALADTAYVDESRALNRAGHARSSRTGFDALGRRATCRRTATSCWSRSATPARVYQRCCAQGVIVRPVANYGLPEYLRVTVGLPAENERFLAALRSRCR